MSMPHSDEAFAGNQTPLINTDAHTNWDPCVDPRINK